MTQRDQFNNPSPDVVGTRECEGEFPVKMWVLYGAEWIYIDIVAYKPETPETPYVGRLDSGSIVRFKVAYKERHDRMPYIYRWFPRDPKKKH